MEVDQMELVKTLLGRDKEAKLLFHSIPKGKHYVYPKHEEEAVYALLAHGKIKADISGQVEEYDMENALTVIASPKGTQMDLKNVGNRTVDIFVLKTY